MQWSWLLLACAGPLVAAPGFVTVHGAGLELDGREYRAIGVNVPHLHQIYNGTWFHIGEIYKTTEAARQAAIDAIVDCRRSGVAFIRYFANPGYPKDIAALYDRDRAAYWQQMDEVVALCRQNQVKLVPSFNTIPGWHHHYGEVGQAILDPQSKTWAAVHEYLRDFVTRYRDDPTILLWELQNEGALRADVDMLGRKALPKGVYPPGVDVREDGLREDSLTWAMFQQLYREQTTFIKQLDPHHPVTSGDAHVRPECTSRRETFPDFKYRTDTWREWLANNLLAQPQPLDVFSYHHYGTNDPPARPTDQWGLDSLELLRRLVRATHAAGAPVFLGELGQSAPGLGKDPTAAWLLRCLDDLEAERVSLAAIWVWHFPWQPDLTVDSRSHPQLCERVAAFNRRWAGVR
ncbi:MAG: cellulase family glycosylhydrolase [Fimbriimonadaceae bacterium]|nr:cellulase family glycosylhydrolase [Fimbriimonadaceae bacterium]